LSYYLVVVHRTNLTIKLRKEELQKRINVQTALTLGRTKISKAINLAS